MGSSGSARVGNGGLWVPHTIACFHGSGWTKVYTLPPGPDFALTFMEWNTTGVSGQQVQVTDLFTGTIIWERFGGASSDEITWDGLFMLRPGHQLQFVESGGFESRFFASGYFVGRPSGIDYSITT